MRIVILCATALILLIGAYQFGYSRGGANVASQAQSPKYWEQVAQLDETLLTDIACHPGMFSSGTYVLEIRYPDVMPEIHRVKLVFADGKMQAPPNPREDSCVSHSLVQAGGVLSWVLSDTEEGPPARYVGMMDGKLAWGRIYVSPGNEWRPSPPAIGVWMLYPTTASDEPNEPSRSTTSP